MSKRTSEVDGGPFPPVFGRDSTAQDMHEADIQNGIESRRAERKRKAGVAAELATAGESLQEQLAAVKKAIRTTR